MIHVNRRRALQLGSAALACAAAPATGAGQAAPVTLDSNLVTVGNSLIDQSVDMVHYFMTDYGRGRGTLTHQTIPGAPLQWNWDNAAQATVNAKAALRRGGQDIFMAVESVPFRHVQAPGDICSITAWSDWYGVAIGNGVKRFFVFEAWPDLQSGRPDYVPEDPGDPDAGMPWRARIDFSRQFYLGIVDYVNARRAGGPRANLVPGGAMFGRIRDDMAAGRAPGGLNRIGDVFQDTIHPNTAGRYAMACLMYACLFRRDPRGMPVTTADIHGNPYPRVPPKQAAYFQTLAWDIARAEPLTGLAG